MWRTQKIWTKIKVAVSRGKKVATHNFKSDLPLEFLNIFFFNIFLPLWILRLFFFSFLLILRFFFSKFQVCFLPLMVVNVADDGVEFPFLHILASVLAWASAVVNPFIYAFKNRQYQQAFIKVIFGFKVTRSNRLSRYVSNSIISLN